MARAVANELLPEIESMFERYLSNGAPVVTSGGPAASRDVERTSGGD
jgi:hypothetical protein